MLDLIPDRDDVPGASVRPDTNTWMKARQAADRAACSTKTIYSEVRTDRLRAARIGAGRNLRFCKKWLDEWLEARAESGSSRS